MTAQSFVGRFQVTIHWITALFHSEKRTAEAAPANVRPVIVAFSTKKRQTRKDQFAKKAKNLYLCSTRRSLSSRCQIDGSDMVLLPSMFLVAQFRVAEALLHAKEPSINTCTDLI